MQIGYLLAMVNGDVTVSVFPVGIVAANSISVHLRFAFAIVFIMLCWSWLGKQIFFWVGWTLGWFAKYVRAGIRTSCSSFSRVLGAR
jgi:hypothetical protein